MILGLRTSNSSGKAKKTPNPKSPDPTTRTYLFKKSVRRLGSFANFGARAPGGSENTSETQPLGSEAALASKTTHVSRLEARSSLEWPEKPLTRAGFRRERPEGLLT